jgi:hypothetical protein
MTECAFCTNSGKLTKEHIFAKWVRDLFPGPVDSFYIGGMSNRNERFVTDAMDWKAKVVCSSCNNTWMKDIEEIDAKPVLTPLITGSETDIPLTQAMARAIAIYSFKTAVVQDHAGRRPQPFFSARVRHAFRESRSIPGNINIWICGIKQRMPRVMVASAYYRGQLSPTYRWEMYAFTSQIGNFVMQVLGVKQFGQVQFLSRGYEDIAIPIWPSIIPGRAWPGSYVFNGDGGDFAGFSRRWSSVRPFEWIVSG